MDCCQLIGSLFKTKPIGEALVIDCLKPKGVAHACRAPRIEVEQLGCGVTDLPGSLGPGLVPLAAPQAVQGGLVGVCAAVATDQMQLRDRNEEAGARGILEVQALCLALAEIKVLKPLVATDAVLEVNNGVAGLEL